MLHGRNLVTLFEKQPRLGEHAHTIEVSADGETIPVEAASAVYARMAPDLVYFYRFLNQASKYLEGDDSSLTIKEFLDELSLPATFRTEFVFPHLMGQFSTEPEEFDQRLACDVLPYSVQCRPRGLSSGLAFEVIGGSRTHIDALTRASGARIEAGVAIERIAGSGAGYVIQKTDGERYECDRLVVATDARAAAGLLTDERDAQDLRSILGKVDFYHSRIAVHRDHDLMPARRSHWSVVNVRYDGTYSQITVFKPWRSNVPVFRSWITFDGRPPCHMYAEIGFQHPRFT